MVRPLRIEYPGAWYHVMNRGAGRKKIFQGDVHYQYFLSLLDDVSTRFGAEIHAYCLMGNHYHLLIHTPEGNLQRIMRHINGLYTQYYNKTMRTDGPLFRGRYKAILVESDNYLLNLSRYIHRNPLEAKRVRRLAAYPWSSYLAYLGKNRVPAWLHTEEVFGQVSGQRRHKVRYQAYVEEDTVTELEIFYRKKALSPILGSERFRKWVLARYGKSDKEIAEQKHLRGVPSANKIIRHVANVYHMKPSEVISAKRGRGVRHYPRLIAMYLCQRVGRMALNDIADLFVVGHYASVSNALGQLRKDMVNDKKLEKQINHLTQDLTS